jgi:DNA-binding beta-propeller fold protein YncE
MTARKGYGRAALLLSSCLLLATACSPATTPAPPGSTRDSPSGSSASAAVSPGPASVVPAPSSPSPSPSPSAELPYAHTTSRDLSPVARRARSLVYVPNQEAGTVQVIDPRRHKVVRTFRVAGSPEHVVPSHDLRRLWVNSDAGNALTPIDPRTGRPGRPVRVADPYNLYFTPDGRRALVMAERLGRVDVRDPRTMRLRRSLRMPCKGLNHADVTATLTRMVVSCEFSGKLVVVDAGATRVLKVINLNKIRTPGASTGMSGPRAMRSHGTSAMPQDVRLAPDGQHFLVADMLRNGVWVVDAHKMRVVRFVHTGRGAHSIYPSRDARRIFVGNRDAGTVSVLDARSLRQTALWRIPGGGSPDMGGVTLGGRELWLSGRYDAEVYVFSTRTGHLKYRIPVRPGPHGLLVWPQPGRFSLGHTGNMR